MTQVRYVGWQVYFLITNKNYSKSWQPNNFQRLVTNTDELNDLARHFSEYEILKKSKVEDVLEEIKLSIYKQEEAYSRGAAMSFFAPALPPEMSEHIGIFLDKKSGVQLAQTTKSAADTARIERDKVLKPK